MKKTKVLLSFIVLCTIGGSCTKDYIESKQSQSNPVTAQFLTFDPAGRTYQDNLLINPLITDDPGRNSVYVSWNTSTLSSCSQIEISLYDNDNNLLSTTSPYSSEGSRNIVIVGQPNCKKYYIRLNTCAGMAKYDTAHFWKKPDNSLINNTTGRNIAYPRMHRRGDIAGIQWNFSSVTTQCGTSLSNFNLKAVNAVGIELVNFGSVSNNQDFYYQVPLTWPDGIYSFVLTSMEACCKFSISTSITVSGDPLQILYPNGGEHISDLVTPSVISAVWDPAFFSVAGNLKIEILKNGVVYATPTANTSNDGAETLSAYLPNPTTDSWKIRITSLSNSNFVCESVGGFEREKYTYPPGTYKPYPTQTWHIMGADNYPVIAWNTASYSGNVKVELYKDGVLYTTVSSSTSNTGSITLNGTSGFPVGNSCWKVKVSQVSNPSVAYWTEYCFYVKY